MKKFAGLDVSLEETAICVVDEGGEIVKEMRSESETGGVGLRVCLEIILTGVKVLRCVV